tara:strand:+ start:82 stop:480 length:399 start_codon:yes stop_codon:yes gene_type:complete
MLDIVLRVYGEQFDVDQFLTQYPDFQASDLFKKGEPDMLGNPNEFSGFDVIVAESELGSVCIDKIKHLISAQQAAFVFLKTHAVNVVLDLDATVDPNDDMPKSLSLSAELLSALSALDIAIEFSAYPQIVGM